MTKLQLWERKLLDMSMSNNLINMSVGKNALSIDKGNIAILEDELSTGSEVDLAQPELTPIFRAARANMEESGANTLFLTLGTLNWSGDGKSGAAPILLVPVELVPTAKEDEYKLRKRDEEYVVNVTLFEFLSYNYGVQIALTNPLPQDEHGVDVPKIMDEVRQAVAQRPDWKLDEDSYLGVFSFTKFVMWNDIHSHADKLLENPIVKSLVDGRLYVTDNVGANDARTFDKNCMPADYALVVDTDSSQFEAVVDCAMGRSFLLYGPPGTGKSQTITNMIANALYHGKRVLFVAQKKAALEVVYHRLNKIGIGPFCLELHSNKVDKKHFLQQMDETINTSCNYQNDKFKDLSEVLFKRRLELCNYVEALHHRADIGYSLYECIDNYLNIEGPILALPEAIITSKTRDDIDDIYNRLLSMDSGEGILGTSLDMFPLHDMKLKDESQQKSSFGVSMPTMAGDTVEALLGSMPQIVERAAQQIERNKNMSFLHRTVKQYLEMDYKWKKFTQKVDIDESMYDDIAHVKEVIDRWNGNIDKLPIWKQYCGRFDELRALGLGQIIDMFTSGLSPQAVADVFMKSYYHQAALYIVKRDPSLSKFNGVVFQKILDEYKALTQEFQTLIRKELFLRLAEKVQHDIHEPELSEELTLLRRRIGNGGRGNTVRTIIQQMPHVMKRLCPCMLMSPVSVAQFIDLESEPFDIVIFDEASQLPTSEAVGAIARGKSAIIVGDPNQMPPTSFFSVKLTSDEESDFDDQESILDDCIALSMPSRYLGWHYRSKHESLISFCNHSFYGGNLVTFPSSDDVVSHVSCQYVDGIYENSTNKIEAQAVVDEVIQRLQSHDTRSIGVVAFSKSQSDAIESLLFKELAKHPELEAIDRAKEEQIFVKNLENVQGDERDIILFSVGYGPDRAGKISNNFGPLKLSGGERRLNVAASRARYEMKLFSSLHPEQIDDRKSDAKGVAELRKFILFAEQGSMSSLNENNKVRNALTKNNMVAQIVEELQKAGYEVHTSVGSSSFKVDIAVVDPQSASNYILGIMCDGKGYYQLKTTRDREIVRPAVLSLLGWNLIHVWSIDWLNNSTEVVQSILKTLSALEKK